MNDCMAKSCPTDMSSVLVIDDEEAFRNLTALALQRRGFETSEASDGKAGTEMALRHLPNLVLCDLHMNGMDGYETLATLRKNPATASIPFIFMTGMGDTASRRRGMELGADDFLEKPFTTDQLCRAVNIRLQQHQALRQHAEKKLTDLRANLSLALPHEMITPLNGIFGLAQLLSSDAATLSADEVAEFGQTILQCAERLHHTVQNFLLFGQLEMQAADPASQAALRQHRTENARGLLEARALHHAERAQRTADLQTALTDAILAIAPDMFTKLADELIENAFKFSKAGTPVCVGTSSAGGKFVLTIADRGQGMTPEQISSLGAGTQFGRQQQEQQGAGLGLAIARRIVELHGGSFSVESQPGQGTTVVASLPVG